MSTEPSFFSDGIRHTYDSQRTKQGRRLCIYCEEPQPQGKPVRKERPVKKWLRIRDKTALTIVSIIIAWWLVFAVCS